MRDEARQSTRDALGLSAITAFKVAGQTVQCEHAHDTKSHRFRSHDHLICRLLRIREPVRSHILSVDRLIYTRKHEEGANRHCFKYGASGDMYEDADDGVQLHILGENSFSVLPPCTGL